MRPSEMCLGYPAYALVLVSDCIGLLREHRNFRDFRGIFDTIFRDFWHFRGWF